MFFSDEHSLSLLDFPRIRENVASYCLSEEGRGLVRAALPIDDGLRLRAFALDLDRLARYLEAHSLPGFSFPSIHEALNRLARPGSSLEMEELLSLGHWSRNFESLTAFLSKVSWERLQADGAGIENAEGAERSEAAELESFDPERLAAVWAEEPAAALIDRLPKLQDVYKIIFNVISPEGEIGRAHV